MIRAGVDAVGAPAVVSRAYSDVSLRQRLLARPLHVLAAGKAAAPMAAAFLGQPGIEVARALAIGTHRQAALPGAVEWIESSHPYPDERSVTAGRRALALAADVPENDLLVLLLSGGASALMAAPIEGLTLADKIATTRAMMAAGADIHALNTVRRHLSRVKGGRLAAACRGEVITLAISDVIGDDLSAIGSGPAVPDPTTWRDAAEALERWGGRAHAPSVLAQVAAGVAGRLPDTLKPGDRRMGRVSGRVIGSRLDAIEGARAAAEARGYSVTVIAEPVVGEARLAAPGWLREALARSAGSPGPRCVVSAGETTVRVVGQGIGGRNLEFSLALAEPLASLDAPMACSSVGTDGIDGPSGVAGAMVDTSSLRRAAGQGLSSPARYLDANDSLAYFDALGDVVRLGRTDTNVGDLQVLLSG